MSPHPSGTTIAWHGAVGVENVAALHEELLARLGQGPAPLTIDLGEVTTIDLSCLQLLLSLRRTQQDNSLPLVLSGSDNPVLLEAMQLHGFAREAFIHHPDCEGGQLE